MLLHHKGRAANEARRSNAAKVRQSQQQQARNQRRFHDDDDDDDDDEEETEELLEDRWRQAAQLLTDEDELRLFGGDKTTKQAAAGTTSGRSNKQQNNYQNDDDDNDDDDNSSISFAQSGCHSILSAWRLKAANRASSRQSRRPISVLSNGSSTGKRSAAASTTLTARSSTGGHLLGRSPASQTRILLGPTSAQHFVTNSRRRRRANELILTTLEARRRALALNRQNASLLGSASYLAAGSPPLATNDLLVSQDDYRLSLSPSPLIEQNFERKASPSPRLGANKVAHSDLGVAIQHRSAASAAEAQRNKLVMMSAKQLRNSLRDQSGGLKSSSSAAAAAAAAVAHKQQINANKRPPLAKLDQNSSDLNTTNSSSSASSESSSSSSGSQFTQLVTSELVAPDCDLLEHQRQAVRTRLTPPNRKPTAAYLSSQQRRSPLVPLTSSSPSSPQKPPRAPERVRRTKSKSSGERSLNSSRAGNNRLNSPETTKQDQTLAGSDRSSKLRRGALRRDSIRRLRLNRSTEVSSRQQFNNESSSSDVAAPSMSDLSSRQQNLKENNENDNDNDNNNGQRFQALSKARRLDIESNPFLNRHHFRTTSVRSNSTGRGSEFGAHSPPPPPPALPPASRAENPSSITRIFGLASRPSALAVRNEQEKPIKRVQREPRVFSQARRSSSTEQVAGNGDNKMMSKQEDVRQVERMLREMKPNQVFTSYSLKEQHDLAKVSSLETNAAPQQLQRGSDWRQQSFDSRLREQHHSKLSQESGKPTKTTTTTTSGGYISPQRQEYKEAKSRTVPNASRVVNTKPTGYSRQQLKSETESRKESETVSNKQPLVNEASRLRDDLKFDRMGNKRQYELAERWRHERTTSPTSDEERYTSKRMELIRSTSISPPPAFADPAKQLHRLRANQEHLAEVRAKESSFPERQTRAIIDQQTNKPPVPTVIRRALSEERPVVAARRKIPGANSSNQQAPPTRQHQQVTSPVLSSPPVQVSLPKFENTAEDEFKKRVDYLRKLARANLHSEPVASEVTNRKQEGIARQAASRPTSTSTTLRPMSTNWRQKDAASDLDSKRAGLMADDERARWNFGPHATTAQSAQGSSQQLAANRNLATTNLDLALLADRYQTRASQVETDATPSNKWRRSNSSLASIGSRNNSSGGSIRPVQRVASPPPVVSDSKSGNILRSRPGGNQQLQPHQPPTGRAGEMLSSAVVKLVVKEKSAPELDYAFVEQQPVVQQAREMMAPHLKKQTNLSASSVQSHQQVTHNQPRPAVSLAGKQQSSLPSKTQTINPSNVVMSQRQTQLRSPLRVASPRSPEFGNMAASSNDDSAIASSVSSPSLSFMLNNANIGEQTALRSGLHQQQQILSTGGRSASPSSLAQRNAINQKNKNSPPHRQTENASGALQSILRRHQQQNQHQSAGYSSDSSGQVATSGKPALVIGAGGEMSAGEAMGGQAQAATRPQEPLFRSDARSPEPASERQTLASDNVQQAAGESSSSAPKRVHFNDRTSIRSFESISSLVSNSTAVPNNDLLIRQQVGSPDSLGSGSTSRLSVESPDMRRPGSLGGGAAIYAVRGDPELEMTSERVLQRQQHHLLAGQLARPIEVSQQSIPYTTAMVRHPPVSASNNPLLYNQMTRYDPANQAFIRMTAPPSISTSGSNSPRTIGAAIQARPVQYIVRPTSMTSTQIVPTMMASPVQANQIRMRMNQMEQDDEEPDYALRLRQAAATNRVFGYVDNLATSNAQQRHLSLPTGHQDRQQQQQHQHQQLTSQQQQPNRRLPMEDLLNFQTEV